MTYEDDALSRCGRDTPQSVTPDDEHGGMVLVVAVVGILCMAIVVFGVLWFIVKSP